jgi:hypothetical protein
MSRWGVFARPFMQETHVAPCDDDGKLLEPHALTQFCNCEPRFEEDLWLHQDPQRGGMDS